MVILDIPDSGAYYVYDGDNIDAEMIRSFIGAALAPLVLACLPDAVSIDHCFVGGEGQAARSFLIIVCVL